MNWLKQSWVFFAVTLLFVIGCTTTKIEGPSRVPEAGQGQLVLKAADPVAWSVDGVGSISENGVYTAPDGILADVTVVIKATYEHLGVTKTVEYVVLVQNTRRVLVGHRIEGPTVVKEGSTTQFRAIATFDDGSTEDVTNEAVWSIGPPAEGGQ